MVVGSPVCYHCVFFILKPLTGDDYSLFVSFPRSCYRVWWSLAKISLRLLAGPVWGCTLPLASALSGPNSGTVILISDTI